MSQDTPTRKVKVQRKPLHTKILQYETVLDCVGREEQDVFSFEFKDGGVRLVLLRWFK